MFDIGFWELAIIALVALLVVGPERLPKLAYTAGKWLGKGRKMLQQVKNEIDKEMKAEELKDILEEQKKQLNPLEEIVEETRDTLRDFTQEANKSVREMEQQPTTGEPSQDRSGDTPK
jgi:sec-independent protein translocase protein TatB